MLLLLLLVGLGYSQSVAVVNASFVTADGNFLSTNYAYYTLLPSPNQPYQTLTSLFNGTIQVDFGVPWGGVAFYVLAISNLDRGCYNNHPLHTASCRLSIGHKFNVISQPK